MDSLMAQNQPAKGPLQRNTDREETQPGKWPSESAAKEKGVRGRVSRVSSPVPPITSHIPHPHTSPGYCEGTIGWGVRQAEPNKI